MEAVSKFGDHQTDEQTGICIMSLSGLKKEHIFKTFNEMY